MICKYNNNYYIIRLRKLIRVIPSFDKHGGITLTPTDETIAITNDIDYEIVQLVDVKKDLEKAQIKKVEADKKFDKFKKFN